MMIEVSIATRKPSKRLAIAKEVGEHLEKEQTVFVKTTDEDALKLFIMVIEDLTDVKVQYKEVLTDARIPNVIELEGEQVNTFPFTEKKRIGFTLKKKKVRAKNK